VGVDALPEADDDIILCHGCGLSVELLAAPAGPVLRRSARRFVLLWRNVRFEANRDSLGFL
jgi:hypothetical protein